MHIPKWPGQISCTLSPPSPQWFGLFLVNFLLHAHLAHREHGVRTVAVGAMLPDLWRLAHRRALPHRLPADADAPRLREGLAHHAATDRWFHEAPALQEGEALLHEIFASERLSAPKLRLFAHPLWELCLDGALVRSLGAVPLRAWLAGAFEEAAVERDPGQRALGDALGADGALFLSRMEKIDRALTQGPWLDAYASGEGLAFCLETMRRRTGLPALPPGEFRRLARRLDEVTPRADQGLALLLSPPR
jgi:acyl carrier protein phosphodiesterase